MTTGKKLTAGRVEVYDTTLRDGAQAEGISFSLQDKLQIAKRLDELRVDHIEGGYPLSNTKDQQFFEQLDELKLRHSRVTAFGMTRKKGTRCSQDVGLGALRKCGAGVLTLVAKSWDMQVKQVLRASLDENLRMIAESVRYLRRGGAEVFFDAEHFFDGYQADPDYAVRTLESAAEAGATRLILCDTNGGTMVPMIEKIVTEVAERFDVPLGIHTHDDCGLAVANSLAAVRCGARQVQGTINGFGERSGNADLCATIANLVLKMGYRCLGPKSLSKLTETSRYIHEVVNLNLPTNQPYVGASSFTHKGGMHAHAVSKNSRCYEHIDPELVGNSRRIVISELSGTSNLLARSEKLAVVKDRALVRKILKRVEQLEHEGYQFETADASFDLIVRRFLGSYHSFFELDHYRTVILKAHGRGPVSEATVKIKIDGEIQHRVAEGDGPVNALDAALRRALIGSYPAIKEMQLVDYRVRVVSPKDGTAAKVRVLIGSRDRDRDWGTIGVSGNIIDATWDALVDSIEYKLLGDEDRSRKSR